MVQVFILAFCIQTWLKPDHIRCCHSDNNSRCQLNCFYFIFSYPATSCLVLTWHSVGCGNWKSVSETHHLLQDYSFVVWWVHAAVMNCLLIAHFAICKSVGGCNRRVLTTKRPVRETHIVGSLITNLRIMMSRAIAIGEQPNRGLNFSFC